MFNNNGRDKKRNVLMITIAFATMTAMIILDFISKWRNAKNYKEKLELKGQRKKYNLDFRFPFRSFPIQKYELNI